MSASGFGELLGRYRVDAGLSQSSLAGIAGVSVETIGALERGLRRAPYPTTIDALAEALRVGDAERSELHAAADRARARTFARDAPTDGTPSTLPRQLTRCVGRAREIADLLALLSRTRVLTVTGPAGIGKTRILFEVAERLPSSRRDTVRVVALGAVGSRDDLVSSVAVACGGSAADHFGTLENLETLLRPQRLLLLLDNCEHLVEAVADAVAAILRSCPNVAFLTTSRERLAVSGETIYRLPSLSPDAALELMVDRISALDSGFAPADRDVSALDDICRALDRIPLALELAAARVPTLGLRAVAERLKGGLALSGGARDLPERQRSMAGAVAWSYSLLDDQERSILARLSVFSGGFTMDAAISVCSETPLERGPVADVLLALVDKSLVNADLVVDTMRYSMLEVIRQFARERLLEADAAESTVQRHAHWCGELAEHVVSVRGSKTPADLRRLLEPELNNVRSALQWLLESGRNPILAGRIIAGLRLLWRYQHRNAEGVRWAEAALAQLDETQVPDVVSGLLTMIIQSTHGVAVGPWIERAIAVTAVTGDRTKQLDLERALAHHYFFVGNIDGADQAIARAAAIVEQDGLLRQAPHEAVLSLRVWIRVEQGRLADARSDAVMGEAVGIALGENEPLNWWITRSYLAYAGNDVAEALRLIAVVIDTISASPAGYAEDLLAAYAYRALFQLSAGNIDAAHAAAREVLTRTRERADYWPCTSVALLAVVAAHRGQVETAARLLGYVESWHRSQPYLPTIAQRQTIDLLRSAIAGQGADAVVEAFAAEGARMNLRWAIDNALAI